MKTAYHVFPEKTRAVRRERQAVKDLQKMWKITKKGDYDRRIFAKNVVHSLDIFQFWV